MAIHFIFLSLLMQHCLSQLSQLTTWTENTSPALPFAISSLMPCYNSDTNIIWLVGGEIENEIWYYSITNNTMTNTVNKLPHALLLLAQSYTQLRNAIYYATSTDYVIHKFNCNTGKYVSTWATTHDETFLIGDRDCPCMANDGQYIFLISGLAGTLAGIQLQIYDNINDIWREGDSLNIGRARSSCAVSPDKTNLYVFAGAHNGNIPPGNLEMTIEKISIADKTSIDTVKSGTWITLSNGDYIMQDNSFYARAVTLGDYIYIMGGRDLNAAQTTNVFLFDPATDTIQSILSSQSGRSSPAVIGVKGTLYSFGGTTSTGDVTSWEISNVLTDTPTPAPTTNPTPAPTMNPTPSPTDQPTPAPTNNPTKPPTNNPSRSPTNNPTKSPTNNPTKSPTINPTKSPSSQPTRTPSNNPSTAPTTGYPSVNPTINPTDNPTRTYNPTADPTISPTKNPTIPPTSKPTTPSPTLKAGNTAKPTTLNGQQVTERTSTGTTDSVASANRSDENNMDTNTLIIIGSVAGVFVVCILILLLLYCHRKNKKLSDALEKTISDSEKSGVMDTLGITNTRINTGDLNTNQELPMVDGDGYQNNINVGTFASDEDDIKSEQVLGGEGVHEVITQFKENADNSDDSNGNEMLYGKSTDNGNAMNDYVSPGNDNITEMAAITTQRDSSDDEADGMYAKGKHDVTAGSD